ncbi:multicopper oxidase domain-containing protein [Pseudonocardia broussonetiae]|uniref:Multicopper oxidase domain-containing protein n=1 Tax=Pseudonocardia broussonetiae TaxID=2736640 RepID=A0A6M6JUN6_9PSEU|nr:multicopper oxidase domain-containing protein [Pseudonocardia broussonetiae]
MDATQVPDDGGRRAGVLALGACSVTTAAGASQRGPATTLGLDAGQVRLDLQGAPVQTWGYNGTVPGPEIRLRGGETLRVPLRNGLPDPTTVHWHGISLVNAMDGAPFLTQPQVEPGTGFDYEFVVPEAGTHAAPLATPKAPAGPAPSTTTRSAAAGGARRDRPRRRVPGQPPHPGDVVTPDEADHQRPPGGRP